METRKEIDSLKIYEKLFPQHLSIQGFETKNLDKLTLDELVKLKTDCREERLTAEKELRDREKKKRGRKRSKKLSTVEQLKSNAAEVNLEIAALEYREWLQKCTDVDIAIENKIKSVGASPSTNSEEDEYSPNRKYQKKHHLRFRQLWVLKKNQQQAFDQLVLEFPKVFEFTQFEAYIVQFRKWNKVDTEGIRSKQRK
jgi:hypothetical protein